MSAEVQRHMRMTHARRSFAALLTVAGLATLNGCGAAESDAAPPTAADFGVVSGGNPPQLAPGALFPVTINRPSGPPVVRIGVEDAEVTLACSTCHDVWEPNFANATTEDLDLFHQDMPFVHGTLSCLSCHNADDYDTLRLADGTAVPFPEVMTLCAQCHGQQARSYDNGAHGGMTGHWDLTRGPRHRNNCVDCHDPHGPTFPMMLPTFKPHDRFLTPTHGAETAHE
jgi:nitrate reductase cytochrome c-type subunit